MSEAPKYLTLLIKVPYLLKLKAGSDSAVACDRQLHCGKIEKFLVIDCLVFGADCN